MIDNNLNSNINNNKNNISKYTCEMYAARDMSASVITTTTSTPSSTTTSTPSSTTTSTTTSIYLWDVGGHRHVGISEDIGGGKGAQFGGSVELPPEQELDSEVEVGAGFDVDGNDVGLDVLF